MGWLLLVAGSEWTADEGGLDLHFMWTNQGRGQFFYCLHVPVPALKQ